VTTIRPAERADAPFLAWVILTAARSHLERGWFDIVLDRPEGVCLEFLEKLAVTEARSWWHYSRFRVAEVAGAPAAALCAFRAGDAYPLSGAAMGEVCERNRWDQETQDAMWKRGSYIFTCTFEDNDDAWTIENVATLPRHRGRGLVVELIAHALTEGREQGRRAAQISYLIGNEPAARAYVAAGFTLDGERRSAEFLAATGAPGLCRVVKRL
jgi:ribosomal protein S18 acetylase RimI-like enzyme